MSNEQITKTLEYYNENAKKFTNSTIDVNFTETQDHFLSYLNEGDLILDFGCGSGRDSKYFLSKGYRVEATDGSIEMCKVASETAGIEVKNMLFEELDESEKYDGIWACSSILHLNKKELKNVLKLIFKAVKTNGYIYTSFKYSEFEGERNGRYFTDFTEESFREYMKDFEGIEIRDLWITSDVRPGRGDEKWLNLILKKNH